MLHPIVCHGERKDTGMSRNGGKVGLDMADLRDGLRVRHTRWGDEGIVRRLGDTWEFRNATHLGDCDLGVNGEVVHPSDLEAL
jgi:hypothetical protein